ncbi:MAG: hypothetical protein WCI73_02455, partial [Phycisphaerae bacterium]
LQQGSMAVGFDIEKDLINSLGDEWIVYGTADVIETAAGGTGAAGEKSIRGVTLVSKLHDPAGAAKALENLESFINGMIAVRLPMAEAQKYQLKAAIVNGITLHSITLPKLTPTWAIKDGYLVVALSPEGVQSGLAATTQKAPARTAEPGYADLAKQLKAPAASSFSYVDLTKTAPSAYEVLTQLQALAVAKAAEAGEGEIKVPTLPPFANIKPFLGPTLKVFWSDEAGFHFKGTEPFPGSTGLLGPGMSGNGMLIGIVTPALQKARERAKTVVSMSNLRQIAVGANLYANENNGMLPPDLGSILPYMGNNVRIFVHPDVKVPAEITKGTVEQQKAWVNANSSYVYLHAGEKLATIGNPASVIAVHEKLDLPGKKEQVNVLYMDGHVESKPRAEAEKALSTTPDK